MPDGSSPAQPRFRVAIVGGGIAGLALAVTLGRYEEHSSRVQIDLYEAGPEITTVGAGISVWPRTWEVMRYLGLYDQLENEAVKAGGGGDTGEMKPAFIYRKSDWDQEGYVFGRVMVPNGSTTMHRAEMVDVLVRNLPLHCSIHTSKRLVKYTESTKHDTTAYSLHFADGTTAQADVVVGADGIKSRTRAAMYDLAHASDCLDSALKYIRREECERCKRATPKWTGTVVYRNLIPSQRLRAINPSHRVLKTPALISYSGRRKHIISYPVSHGKYINLVPFVSNPHLSGSTYPHQKWVGESTREECLQHYVGWEPEVDQLLQCVENPTIWAIHVVEDLPFSVRGRVALMGDAVHAMSPHFGAGGGQAIEDAFILGRLLAEPRVPLARVPDVLRIYEDVRLPFAQAVVKNTDKVGHMYEFDYPGLDDGAPLVSGVPEETKAEDFEVTKQRLDELGGEIVKMWEWAVKEKVGDQWEDAERRLDTLVEEERQRNSSKASRAWRWTKVCPIM